MIFVYTFLLNLVFANERENLAFCANNAHSNGRVISPAGNEPVGKWPYLVRLAFRSRGSEDGLGCGGTIISDRLILTARVKKIA